jgi:hypothetical protein
MSGANDKLGLQPVASHGFKDNLAFWIANQEGNERAIFGDVRFDDTHLIQPIL